MSLLPGLPGQAWYCGSQQGSDGTSRCVESNWLMRLEPLSTEINKNGESVD